MFGKLTELDDLDFLDYLDSLDYLEVLDDRSIIIFEDWLIMQNG